MEDGNKSLLAAGTQKHNLSQDNRRQTSDSIPHTADICKIKCFTIEIEPQKNRNAHVVQSITD